MRVKLSPLILAVSALVLSIIAPVPSATATQDLVTCVNLQTGEERISRSSTCILRLEAQVNWNKSVTDTPIASGPNAKVIVVCANKSSSRYKYRVIRKSCSRHQSATVYSRSIAQLTRPVIVDAVSYSHDNASLKIAQETATRLSAPIAYYTITTSQVEMSKEDTSTIATLVSTRRVYSEKDLRLAVNGLRELTTYIFTITATNADGTSPVSLASKPVTTRAYLPPATSTTSSSLSAPAFTLSTLAETITANSGIAGYSISSTGGAIASYSISPTVPTGITFDATTGLITGTPTLTQSATNYSITGTNATGSTSRTFTLTVIAASSNDATLAVSSTIKGQGSIVLGTPNSVLASASGGSITISRTKAADTSNSGSFVTAFNKTSSAATVNKIVKYAVGATYSSFATDTAYNGTAAISDGDFFIIKVTAENGTTILYYKIDVRVTYAVGDIGPGGGIVYYFLEAGFNCGASYSATGSPTGGKCNYLEVAPSSWGTSTDRSAMPWAVTKDVGTDISEIPDEAGASNNSINLIGLGYKYSEYIVAQNGSAYNSTTNLYAAGSARAYTGGGKNDWYLPSSAELNTLCQWNKGLTQSFTSTCIGGTINSSTYGAQSSGFYNGVNYWASSENGASGNGKISVFNVGQGGLTKSTGAYVRPIRAF